MSMYSKREPDPFMDDGTTRRCYQFVYVPTGNWGYYHQCAKRAKVEEDGEWHCGIHSKEGTAKRQQRSNERVDKYISDSHRKHDIERAEREVIQAARIWADKSDATDYAVHGDNLWEAVEKLNKLYAQRV